MLSESLVQKVVDDLYLALSFEEECKVGFNKLGELFLEGGKILEYLDSNGKKVKVAEIVSYVNQIEKSFCYFSQPQSYVVKEISNNIIIEGPMAFVRSIYEKIYLDNSKRNEMGINFLHLVKLDGEIKILSLTNLRK